MNRINNLLIVFIICLVSCSNIWSKVYQGEITLKSNEIIEAEMLVIKDDLVKYRTYSDTTAKEVDINSVRLINVDDGDYAFEGMMLGLSLGVGYTFLAKSSNDLILGSWITTYIITSGVGMIIGIFFDKSKTIRFNDDVNISFLNGVTLMPEINQPNITLINYSIRF